LGGFSFAPVLASYARFGLAALPASVAGVSILIAFGGAEPGAVATATALSAMGVGALITVSMVVVYFLMLVLLRDREVKDLLSAIQRRRAPQ